MKLHLATRKGYIQVQGAGIDFEIVHQALPNEHLNSLIAFNSALYAGGRAGVFRSTDDGQSWEPLHDGLHPLLVRWLGENGETVLAGTEPASILALDHESWQPRPEVGELRDQHGWFLPYTPEAGCVRGFSHHGQRIYAAVEVGAALRSDDAGATWSLAKGSDGNPSFSQPQAGFIYPDVHDIAVHPSDPDRVFAATGGGLYRSTDGGAHWDEVYDCYCRALWLDPHDPDHLIFGPADHVGARGRLEESMDGGGTFRPASGCLDVPWPHTMPERLAQVDDALLCVLDDGRVLIAQLGEWDWQFILPGISDVHAAIGG
jgi:hypothetical protein